MFTHTVGIRSVLFISWISWAAPESSHARPRLDPFRAQVSFFLQEWQPDVPYGGRVDAIAVHPFDEDVLIVGTETGGLFRSTDQGATFSHVDSFPAWEVYDVAFDPTDPNVVLATTRADFRGANGGGIWRSTNSGGSWAKPATATPSGSRCRSGATAHKIAVAPDTGAVFVTTDCGISRSPDRGETWTHSSFPGSTVYVPAYSAIVALAGGRVIAAGRMGIVRSEDGGDNWTPVTSAVGAVVSHHALSRILFTDASRYRATVFLVNDRFELWTSATAGRTWARVLGPPPGGRVGCGGQEFVRVGWRDETVSPALLPGFDVYLGNRCHFFRSRVREAYVESRRRRSVPRSYPNWSRLAIDHDDTRDFAFFPGGGAGFLATDGGFHRTADRGSTWTLSGSGRGGLNALQLYTVTGQRIESPRRYDLYIGTQDNNLWSSPDTGRSWPYFHEWEGFNIHVEPTIDQERDSYVTYMACSSCNNFLSEAHFREAAVWPENDFFGLLVGGPHLIAPRAHVQPIVGSGLALTDDFGATWNLTVATFGGEFQIFPKVSRYGIDPVLYQAIRSGTSNGNGKFVLARVSSFADSRDLVSPLFPTMDNFGSIGVHGTNYVFDTVYAVDPQDPMHLLAADTTFETMARSTDGGQTWTEMEPLTDLLTRGGALSFRLDVGGMYFSLASAVSFSPQDPNIVLAGSYEGGLFLSADRGSTWQRIPGSERVPRMTGAHWQTQGTAFISTFGRGLWRLSVRLRYGLDLFPIGCDKCTVFDLSGRPGHSSFNRALLAFGGSLSDATAKEAQLESLFVTPGTTTVFFSDRKDDFVEPLGESSDFGDFEGLEVAQKLSARGLVVRGLTFKEGAVNGVVASEQEVFLEPPGALVEFKDEGNASPGNENDPYISLVSNETIAGNTVVSPAGILEVIGRGFSPARPIELLLDGSPLKIRTVRVVKKGTFKARIRLKALRLRPGLHSITAVQKLSPQLVLDDTAPFGVSHEDISPQK